MDILNFVLNGSPALAYSNFGFINVLAFFWGEHNVVLLNRHKLRSKNSVLSCAVTHWFIAGGQLK